MKHLNPYRLRTYPNSREWVVTIKAATWLAVLFLGNPSIHGAIVGLIGRLG